MVVFIRLLLYICLLYLPLAGICQYKTELIFPGESGSNLLTLLFNQYKTNTVLNYTDARLKMYKSLYNVHDSVSCVYSHYTLYLDPNYPNPIDYLSKGGSDNGINCEHTFPQSKGAENGNARSDMHHLFPARAAVNEARSNYPYAEIDDNKTKSWFYLSTETNAIPKTNIDEYSESINGSFEPREDHKGNVARAIFYFYTMYEIQSDQSFFEQMKSTLCNWHLKDPVDSLEWVRTFEIAKYQEDKPNPFVVDCTLPFRCYCQNTNPCLINSTRDLSSILSNSVQPNPFQNKLLLHLSKLPYRIFDVKICNINGSIMFCNSFDNELEQNDLLLYTEDWDAGFYILTVRSIQSGTMNIKIFKK